MSEHTVTIMREENAIEVTVELTLVSHGSPASPPSLTWHGEPAEPPEFDYLGHQCNVKLTEEEKSKAIDLAIDKAIERFNDDPGIYDDDPPF
jgi:hypothetical protein